MQQGPSIIVSGARLSKMVIFTSKTPTILFMEEVQLEEARVGRLLARR